MVVFSCILHFSECCVFIIHFSFFVCSYSPHKLLKVKKWIACHPEFGELFLHRKCACWTIFITFAIFNFHCHHMFAGVGTSGSLSKVSSSRHSNQSTGTLDQCLSKYVGVTFLKISPRPFVLSCRVGKDSRISLLSNITKF